MSSPHLLFALFSLHSNIVTAMTLAMETLNEDLLAEQKKTNELLSALLQEQQHKRRQEARHFWVNSIWQALPVIIIGLMLWGMYQYVHTQIDLFQTKFAQIQNQISGFSLGNQLKSFF